ncbi:hypothetical protein NQ318_007646 [Aromia moschata]|uniref:Nuclear pore complex protein n=1 Tax=Aromia moschata TaxID=1265417 RepID=A0AAV8XHE3_9CUCU|nr:hypothetical protein NQ318_007646 [Aromia moschata]
MENDRDTTVQLLQDTLSPSKLGLTTKMWQNKVDVSLYVTSQEIKKILNIEGTIRDNTEQSIVDIDRSLKGDGFSKLFYKTAVVDGLCTGFFEILQSHSGHSNILEIISDFAHICLDALKVIQDQKSKNVNQVKEEAWLKNEAKTWKLIFIIYQDRLLNHVMDDRDIHYFGKSEEQCIRNLFRRESLIRESQLVIDWLEYNAATVDFNMPHCSEKTIGWENTLHQLQSAETIAFSSSRQIVTQIHPDSSFVEHKPLHDLDIEDEKRLSKRIFAEIRCGKLEEAQKLCRQYGHPWKAAIFEGWRLFHNCNIKEQFEEDVNVMECNDGNEKTTCELQQINGNYNRDTWKNIAIKFCKQDYLNEYEKAAIGSYCGYIKSVLPVCYSWEDHLWAYIKSMVDIRVESEIRDFCTRNKKYLPLPEEYWSQRTSLNEIFLILETSKSALVQEESGKPEHIVQKFIILDDISKLYGKIGEWIEDFTIPTYCLTWCYFLIRLVRVNDRSITELVLERYIKRLMEANETQLIAYYIGKLNSNKQVNLYSEYLEKIVDNEERKSCLMYGESSGIDVLSVTKQIVENIRNLPYDIEPSGHLQPKITNIDIYKIEALDWVLFYDHQRVEALIQTNALISSFLSLGKLDAAYLAIQKIPKNTVEKILSEGNESEEVSQTVKQYFSFRAYLDASEAFNKWFKQYKLKPLPPDDPSKNSQFAEKVAHQHKMSQYKADMERWKLTISHLAKNAKAMLYNVLLFPEGWLVGAKEEDFLRSTCIPEVVLLLYLILFESKEYVECLQLVDIIASETQCIYKVYSKEKLQEILKKLCEVSLILLDMKKDPWGNDVTI